MQFRIADTFTARRARLSSEQQKAAKMTCAFLDQCGGELPFGVKPDYKEARSWQ